MGRSLRQLSPTEKQSVLLSEKKKIQMCLMIFLQVLGIKFMVLKSLVF